MEAVSWKFLNIETGLSYIGWYYFISVSNKSSMSNSDLVNISNSKKISFLGKPMKQQFGPNFAETY